MDIALASNGIDYYRMLGLDQSTPVEAIQGAYRILARRLHPDVTGDPSTAEAMTRANKLYEALVARPVPSEFAMDKAPVLRRSQSANEPIARYLEAMAGYLFPGQRLDILA